MTGAMLTASSRLRRRRGRASTPPGRDLALVGRLRIARGQTHQEAIQLGLRQRVRALELDRVLGGDDQERGVEREALALGGDLRLRHGFEQTLAWLGGAP